MLFPNNMKMETVHTLRKTQHIIPSTYTARIFFQQPYVSSFLFCPLDTPLLSSALHRAFSSRPPILPSWPVLLFYATTLTIIYTVCIYFTARRKTSRPCLPLFPLRRLPPSHSLDRNVITASEPVVACTGWL